MEDKLTRVFSRTPSSWDPQDDLLLRHLKEQQKLGWKEIASHFAHRTPNACQFRWRRLRSGSLKGANGGSSSAPSSNQSTPPTVLAKDGTSSPSTSPPSQSPLSSSVALTLGNAHTPQTKLHVNGKGTTGAGATKVSKLSRSYSSSQSRPMQIPEMSYTFKQAKGKKIIANEDDGADPLSSSINSSSSDEWTPEEDGLLLARRRRALSFAELSILLPQRSEAEIHKRISTLEPKASKETLKDTTKHVYLTATPKRKRHSHSVTPIHSGGVLRERSFSSSSQNSVGFLSGDALRSKSFSYTVPPLFNNMTPVGDRYTLRKGSISNVRRNSVLRESAVSDDEDEKHTPPPISRTTSVASTATNATTNSTTTKLPSLGVLFHDYFTK